MSRVAFIGTLVGLLNLSVSQAKPIADEVWQTYALLPGEELPVYLVVRACRIAKRML